jgi:hypothetical protein
MRLILLNQDVDIEWRHKQRRLRRRGSQGEFSFLVNTRPDPGISLTGERVGEVVQAAFLWLLWCTLVGP